jgi:NAD+ synthase (glutamine-hydrolysing)
MKLAICQLNFTVGDIEGNVSKILDAYQRAVSDGADLAVFSELSICGYPPQDLLDYPHFIEKCRQALLQLAEITGETAMIVGCPLFSDLKEGKKLYNSAAFLWNGEIKEVFVKTLLPTYNIFDEYRYFEPNTVFKLLEFKGLKLAITICEDLWDIDEPRMYKSSPMKALKALGPDLLINLSGSPFSYKHIVERRELMRQNALLYDVPLFYVNQIGANTDLIFDGGSMFIDRDGVIAEELEYFEEDYRLVNWQPDMAYSSHSHNYHNDDIALIYDALKLGLVDYFKKSGFKKAILGLSGGIDSAVVTAIIADALGKENVIPVMLPSRFSSDHSVSDSEKLCQNLGIASEQISIHEVVDAFESKLTPVFNNMARGLAEENIQARTRGVLLMAMSNKFGYILLNTTNKSEAAVGYGTLYGDMCGGISVLGDVYKTQVYELARYINRNGEAIPQNILIKAPSAELSPGQKDSDSLPDYALLDKILHLYIEELNGPEDIIEKGYAPDLVYKIIKMVDKNEYKRFQVPPILRVSDKAFGIGRQMPVVGKLNS